MGERPRYAFEEELTVEEEAVKPSQRGKPLALVSVVIGCILLTAGFALIFIPAALILAGSAFVIAGVAGRMSDLQRDE